MNSSLEPVVETPREDDTSRRGRPIAFRHRGLAQRYALLIAWALLIVVFGALRPNTFLTPANFQSIASSDATLLILTLGLLPAVAVGTYDLSVAATFGLSLVIVGWLNVSHGWAILPAIGVALGAGLGVGMINAFVIVVLNVDSIVATLGMGTLLSGVALGINNLSVSGVSHSLVVATTTTVFGVQVVFLYALGLTIFMWYVFRFTPLGRYLFFVGAGGDVARLSGIRVSGIRAGASIFTGFIAAVAGVLLAGTVGGADPTTGPTFLLPAFASAFLGATAVTPGRFNPWGAFIAVYFLDTGITGLELLGLSGYIEQVFFGAALVLAVAVPRLLALRRRRA